MLNSPLDSIGMRCSTIPKSLSTSTFQFDGYADGGLALPLGARDGHVPRAVDLVDERLVDGMLLARNSRIMNMPSSRASSSGSSW